MQNTFEISLIRFDFNELHKQRKIVPKGLVILLLSKSINFQKQKQKKIVMRINKKWGKVARETNLAQKL